MAQYSICKIRGSSQNYYKTNEQNLINNEIMNDRYGNLISSLAEVNEKKIVLLVMDGLGDCNNDGKGTSLQRARTPNMDKLAVRGILGLSHPVAPAVTPGSGPGHLGLFGYDPLIYKVGRGVLSALGIDFPLQKGDIAARLNFCTLDNDGNVTDRRAGRISTEKNESVVKKINKEIAPPGGLEVFFQTVSEHRALMVIRGKGLDDDVPDTDPQKTGVPPLEPDRSDYSGSSTAKTVKKILDQLRDILHDEKQTNFVLARGFAMLPNWPDFEERYKLKPAAVAGYPMYRGVSRLVGIPVFSEPKSGKEVCDEVVKAMKDHTFVFGHYKYTDKTGEDGDADAKAAAIEEVDKALPVILENEPDVLIITGDHSTPAAIKAHSWHPVPLLMKVPYPVGGHSDQFNEITCRQGELGTIYAREIIPLAMAHTLKLAKYGA